MIKITVPHAQYDNFKDDMLQASLRGYKANFDGVNWIQFVEISDTLLTQTRGKELIAAGGEIENKPVYAKITSGKYKGNTPACIPNRTYLDEEGVEHIKTWDQWLTTPAILADSYYYVILSTSKNYIKFSEAVALWNLAGYYELTEEEYKANMPQEEV
jgi:hypothetical protein